MWGVPSHFTSSLTKRVELTSEEMLAAQAQVSHLAMGNVGYMSIKCVVELNIPEPISAHDQPFPHSELLAKLSCLASCASSPKGATFRLQKNNKGEAYYSLSPSTTPLKDTPASLSSWVLCRERGDKGDSTEIGSQKERKQS